MFYKLVGIYLIVYKVLDEFADLLGFYAFHLVDGLSFLQLFPAQTFFNSFMKNTSNRDCTQKSLHEIRTIRYLYISLYIYLLSAFFVCAFYLRFFIDCNFLNILKRISRATQSDETG